MPGWDYRRKGYYVITIVLADRRVGRLGQLVVKKPSARAEGAGKDGTAAKAARAEGGDVAGRGGALLAPAAQADGWVSVDEARALKLRPDEVEAKIVFSELGRAIFDHFRRIGEFTPGLEPVYSAVMPEHLHLLIRVANELARPLGNAIAGFKTGCEKIYRAQGGEGRLFAEGFVDEVVLRAGQLAAEFDYLVDNPRRLAVKRLSPELFKVSRELRVDFRLAPKGQVGHEPTGLGAAVGRGAAVGSGEVGRGAAVGRGGVSFAPAAPAVGWFSAVGNHFLLSRAEFCQIQVSRRFFAYRRDAHGRLLKGEPPAVATPEFDAKLANALAAARRGAVLVSPCISEGEREIARRAFEAGARVITLQNKGFSPLYKPGGKLFETCADGRLLMLAPAAWPYQPAEKPMTRVDALVLNRLAQLIAGEDAVAIDYRGVTVGDVDRLVAEAVRGEKR